MKPVKFPEVNVIIAKNQPPYLPLPAWTMDEQVISCWSLTIRERFKVFFTGRVWLKVLTFKQPLQPQKLTVDRPFVKQKVLHET